LFLTKKINDAGCYAIKFVIDGEERVVVVDDYLPIKKNKRGEDSFAFAKSSKG